jgi:site-specific DNA recombinase
VNSPYWRLARTSVPLTLYKESGSCTNSRKVNRDAIEAAVFAGLKDELSNPIAITEYFSSYNDERRRLAREAGDRAS